MQIPFGRAQGRLSPLVGNDKFLAEGGRCLGSRGVATLFHLDKRHSFTPAKLGLSVGFCAGRGPAGAVEPFLESVAPPPTSAAAKATASLPSESGMLASVEARLDVG